ncbi:hypothetical protein D3C73_1512360 [compost metagenome]
MPAPRPSPLGAFSSKLSRRPSDLPVASIQPALPSMSALAVNLPIFSCTPLEAVLTSRPGIVMS